MTFRPDESDDRTDAPRGPILFLIDVEPDARKTDGIADGGWKGSDDALEHLDRLRHQFEDATGAPVQFNWFLRADPQIEATWGRLDWLAESCPRIVRAICDSGDFRGMHIHMWRWSEARRLWFNDFSDPEWTAQCLGSSIDGFKLIFGDAPTACRFGDRWLNQHAVDLMRASGIRYDLTIEPGMPDVPIHDDPNATGSTPDYRGALREPYVPSSENFLEAAEESAAVNPDGSAALCMVPLTTSLPAWRLVRRPPYLMKASRSPNLALSSSHVLPHLQSQLASETQALVTIVLRSGDLSDPDFRGNFLRTTSALVRESSLARWEFTNPARAVEMIRASRR